MKRYAIILAAGAGQRTGYNISKQFIKVAGKTIIEHTLSVFEQNNDIDEIVVVINPTGRNHMEEILLRGHFPKVKKLLNGGRTRRESSWIGLNAISNNNDVVLIHDAVRPFLSNRIITECLKALENHDAVDVAIAASDTIIQLADTRFIRSIPARRYMMQGQTPQGFKVGLIKEAHRRAEAEDNLSVTDDCGLVLKYGLADVYVVDGDEENIKITYPMDIYIADKMFQLKSAIVPKNLSLQPLKGKVMAVFGGTRGIGKSIVEMARVHGAKPYMCSRNSGVNVGVSDEVDGFLKNIFEKEGQIDFVINTAAILKMGKLEDRKADEIDEEINTNYLGNINVVKYAIPYLKKINVSK